MSRLDVNQASQEDLDAVDGLRGHGHEIVRYREERGGFTSLRELDEVPGLTGKVDAETLARLIVRSAGAQARDRATEADVGRPGGCERIQAAKPSPTATCW